MIKKVWSYFDLMVVATTRNEAIDLVVDELGSTPRTIARHLTKVIGPFEVVDQDGVTKAVSEQAFCDSVETYGGGIVKEP
jgi:hypothetical protein